MVYRDEGVVGNVMGRYWVYRDEAMGELVWFTGKREL
jgi:hypothetical protein